MSKRSNLEDFLNVFYSPLLSEKNIVYKRLNLKNILKAILFNLEYT